MNIEAVSPAFLISGGLVLGSLILWCSKGWSGRKYKVGLTYKPNKRNQYILNNCPSIADTTTHFKPPFLLSHGQVQTLLTAFAKTHKLKHRREYIDLEDGGTVALDWTEDGPELSSKAPVLIILPTMTGDVHVCSLLCKLATERGYRCVVFNKRGHGNSILKTPKLQGFGETKDLREAVLHIDGLFPDAKKTMQGSSAGSALLVSYLGDYGKDAIVCTGVIIAPGYDMINLFANCLPFFYEVVLLYHLKLILKAHRKILESVIDMKAALSSWTFKNYDYHVYAKFGGQKSTLEYWQQNNPMRGINTVTVPVLAINSLDDPVCVKENIPFEILSNVENLILLTLEKGGHCGYLDGFRSQSSWPFDVALDFMDVVLKSTEDKVY